MCRRLLRRRHRYRRIVHQDVIDTSISVNTRAGLRTGCGLSDRREGTCIRRAGEAEGKHFSSLGRGVGDGLDGRKDILLSGKIILAGVRCVIPLPFYPCLP